MPTVVIYVEHVTRAESARRKNPAPAAVSRLREGGLLGISQMLPTPEVCPPCTRQSE